MSMLSMHPSQPRRSAFPDFSSSQRYKRLADFWQNIFDHLSSKLESSFFRGCI